MLRFILALAIFGFSSAAIAQPQPWVVYGQTQITHQDGIWNPAPNNNGLLGEVHTLPYVVPDGKILILRRYGMEAYDDAGAAVIFPYIGVSPPTSNNQAMMSAASKAASSDLRADWYIPAGKILNFRIYNSSKATDWVFGWFAQGELIDAPAQ